MKNLIMLGATMLASFGVCSQNTQASQPTENTQIIPPSPVTGEVLVIPGSQVNPAEPRTTETQQSSTPSVDQSGALVIPGSSETTEGRELSTPQPYPTPGTNAQVVPSQTTSVQAVPSPAVQLVVPEAPRTIPSPSQAQQQITDTKAGPGQQTPRQ